MNASVGLVPFPFYAQSSPEENSRPFPFSSFVLFRLAFLPRRSKLASLRSHDQTHFSPFPSSLCRLSVRWPAHAFLGVEFAAVRDPVPCVSTLHDLRSIRTPPLRFLPLPHEEFCFRESGFCVNHNLSPIGWRLRKMRTSHSSPV